MLIHRAIYLVANLTITSENCQDFAFTYCFITTLKSMLNFSLHKSRWNVSSHESWKQSSRNPFQRKPSWIHYRSTDTFSSAISSKVTVWLQSRVTPIKWLSCFRAYIMQMR